MSQNLTYGNIPYVRMFALYLLHYGTGSGTVQWHEMLTDICRQFGSQHEVYGLREVHAKLRNLETSKIRIHWCIEYIRHQTVFFSKNDEKIFCDFVILPYFHSGESLPVIVVIEV